MNKISETRALDAANQMKRIADALEKLATPPEVVTLTQDGEWAVKEKAREQRDERTVVAFDQAAKENFRKLALVVFNHATAPFKPN